MTLGLENLIRSTAKAPEGARLLQQSGHFFLPTAFKLPEKEKDRSVLAKIGPVPVGFQFGTAMGFEGAPGFVLDVFSDPFTFVGGVGSLTKAGRAGIAVKAAAGLRQGDRTLDAMRALARTEGLTPEQTLKLFSNGLENAGRLDPHDVHRVAQVVQDAREGGSTAVIDALRKFQADDQAERFKALQEATNGRTGVRSAAEIPRNRMAERVLDTLRGKDGSVERASAQVQKELLQRTKLQQLAQQMGETQDFSQWRKLAKEMKKLDPSARTQTLLSREVMDGFKVLMNSFRGEAVKPLSRGAARQAGMKTPQRTLLKFQVPFGPEQTIAVGANVMEGGPKLASKLTFGLTDALGNRAKVAGLVPGARRAMEEANRRLRSNSHVADVDTLFDVSLAAAKASNPLSIDPRMQFQDISRGLQAETLNGRVKADLFENEFKAVLDSRGLNNDRDLNLLMELVDDPDKFLMRPKSDVVPGTLPAGIPGATSPATGNTVTGRFGKSSIFGELNDLGTRAGVTDDHIQVAEAIDASLKKAHNLLMDEGVVSGFVTEYFPRRVAEILKPDEFRKAMNALRSRVDSTPTFFKHNQPRILRTLDQFRALEKKGILRMEKDPKAILRAYFEEASRAAANGRFLERFSAGKMPETVTEGVSLSKKQQALVDKFGGLPLVLPQKHAEELGDFYDAVSDPAVTAFARKMEPTLASNKFLKGGTVWLHKDISRQVTSVIAPQVGRPRELLGLSEQSMQKGLELNSVFKRMLLGFSGFHFMALTESGGAALGADFVRRIPEIAREGLGFRNGAAQRMFWEQADVVETAIRSGLQIGPMVDAEVAAFQGFLGRAQQAIPQIDPALRAIRGATMGFDRALWDYYHNSAKVFSFHELYLRGLQRNPGVDSRRVAEATSDWVNNAFGGQVWENLWISKNGQRMLRGFMLAPDWNLSNLRVAADIFANRFKRNELGRKVLQVPTQGRANFPISAEDLLRADVRATFSRDYALRTSFMFLVMANMANFAFTGHFMDENSPDHRWQIQLPWTDGRDRNQYLRFGKQFREPWELITDPVGTANRKTAVVPSQIMSQLRGVDMFGRPFLSSEDGPLEELSKRTGFMFGGLLPISVQQALPRGQEDKVLDQMSRSLFGTLGLPVKTEFIRKRNGGEDTPETREGDEGIPAGFQSALSPAIGNAALERSLNVARNQIGPRSPVATFDFAPVASF